ncbi:MAG: hypothetical protein AB8B50_13615 [Pirellulaceae bacterium]
MPAATESLAKPPRFLAAHRLLHNCPVTIYTGGQPRTAREFAFLRKMGVRTVVSVDGAPPNLKLARLYGLNYVHIPLGYDGVERRQSLALASVFDRRDGAYFVHCHHGRHRAPAAAACAVVVAGLATSTEALKILDVSETGHQYAGLWGAVQTSVPRKSGEAAAALQESVPVEPIAQSMASLGRLMDELDVAITAQIASGSTAATGEATDESAPTSLRSSPSSIALLIKEHFQELSRKEILPEEMATVDFMKRLRDSRDESESLYQAVQQASRSATDTAKNQALLRRLKSSCKNCHTSHRD